MIIELRCSFCGSPLIQKVFTSEEKPKLKAMFGPIPEGVDQVMFFEPCRVCSRIDHVKEQLHFLKNNIDVFLNKVERQG